MKNSLDGPKHTWMLKAVQLCYKQKKMLLIKTWSILYLSAFLGEQKENSYVQFRSWFKAKDSYKIKAYKARYKHS